MLVGVSSAGKSSFARQHFKPTEVISSDYCRGLVSDDETDQSATRPAFEVLDFIVRKRLEARRLTVIDATNIRPEDRKHYINLAREYYAPSVAIILNPPESMCHERNKQRTDRASAQDHPQWSRTKRIRQSCTCEYQHRQVHKTKKLQNQCQYSEC